MGNIVEIEGEDGLFINLGISKNYEDMGSCSYDREYKLYEYHSELPDDLHISENNTISYKLTGTKNTIKIREDKIPYEKYGFSEIEGKKVHMYRRKYPEPAPVPTI